MKQNIIAVDFDGTLCENKWPEIGMPNGFAEIDETEYKARKEAAKARMEATDGAK